MPSNNSNLFPKNHFQTDKNEKKNGIFLTFSVCFFFYSAVAETRNTKRILDFELQKV
jgi:hypothetical protein